MKKGIDGWMKLLWMNAGVICPLVSVGYVIKETAVITSPGRHILGAVVWFALVALGVATSVAILQQRPIAFDLALTSLAAWTIWIVAYRYLSGDPLWATPGVFRLMLAICPGCQHQHE